MQELSNTINLTDENGNEIAFEFLDLIKYQGEEFVVLLPTDQDDEAGEVVILKVENDDGDTESYTSVDDDNLLNTVFEIFKEKYKDMFNFEDTITE